MGGGNAAHAPGAEREAVVQKNGAKESVAAFASNAVLKTSTLNGPCIGAEAARSLS